MCRAASRCQPTEQFINLPDSRSQPHTPIDTAKDHRKGSARVERTFTPPRQIPGGEVLDIQAVIGGQTVGNEPRENRRAPDAVSFPYPFDNSVRVAHGSTTNATSGSVIQDSLYGS